MMEPDLLQEFLNRLHEITGFRDSANEVTMEANPESMDLATATAARQAGVDRVSIGFQSLRGEVLRAYDRVHDPEDAIRAFHATREAGIERVNIDMIYAFPGQDPGAWFRDLEQVHALEPEHLSCYELTYEPGTSLTRLRDAGRWRAEDPDLCLELFLETRARNLDAGYHAYEVSAFAKEGEACRHNLAYWRSLNYVGVGAGAAGWDGVVRRRNVERPETYEAMVREGKDPVDLLEQGSDEMILFDALMMGLRLQEEGVQLQRLQRTSGLDLLKESGTVVRSLCEQGLLELLTDTHGSPSRLRATAKGFLLLDDILQRFLPEDPALQV
jgi:oxygen-independent coproporphyrinogen-3 oxidase